MCEFVCDIGLLQCVSVSVCACEFVTRPLQ